MPLYEYECTTCHKRTEKIKKYSDPEITVCPHCSGHLERVLSAPAIAFKGGGWYADGYGNAKPKSAAADGAGSANGNSSGDAGSSSKEKSAGDSKSAAESSSGEAKSSPSSSPKESASASTPAAAPASTSSSTEKK